VKIGFPISAMSRDDGDDGDVTRLRASAVSFADHPD
jgi:hypothetical protein